MRELAGRAPGADPLRVAVLAALRLADEARLAREEAGARESEISARIAAFNDRLEGLLRTPRAEDALEGPPEREIKKGNGRDGSDRPALDGDALLG
jgi:cell division protein ZapA (FtsZ GTPase activity inhibitor)